MALCKKVTTKKYKTRKSPPYHANECKNQVKTGNDGKKYKSIADARGIYKWIIFTNKTRKNMKPGTSSKTYTMIDNGSNAFVADVYPSKIEIYKLVYISDNDDYVRDKRIVDTPYNDIFIGDNALPDVHPAVAPKGMYPGNSIVIKTDKNKYIYSGHEVYSFETLDGDEIKKYYSPVGNSYVPYPYAVGEKYTYFMLDKQAVPNELLNLKEDAYGQFYGHTVEDEGLKANIEASKKKFKTKLIHKRNNY